MVTAPLEVATRAPLSTLVVVVVSRRRSDEGATDIDVKPELTEEVTGGAVDSVVAGGMALPRNGDDEDRGIPRDDGVFLTLWVAVSDPTGGTGSDSCSEPIEDL